MIEPLAIPSGPAALTLLPRLRAALAGGAPIAPHAPGAETPGVPIPATANLPDDLAVVVGTSGSTGAAKLAMLTAAALTASADVTHDRLGGPGQWLLTLPAHHIAGLQVLLRSLRAGTIPVVLDLTAGFQPAAFAAAVATMDAALPRYTSLVPAQLSRILDDPAARAAATSLTTVLLGGQSLDPLLRARAAAARITVVATYGMSETCGGCVYDGQPLAGVQVAIDEADGRISLGGNLLAAGYLDRPRLTAAAFEGRGTERWFHTDDHGHVDEHGILHVDGRLDELINTGGLKVAPRLVEEALRAHVPGVRDACVVGIPDPLWGQVVAAVVVPAPAGIPSTDLTAAVRERLRAVLAEHALPRRVISLDELPASGPGKPDRRAVRAILSMGE